jgi:hypothetical protein
MQKSPHEKDWTLFKGKKVYEKGKIRITRLNCISEDDKNKQGSIVAALSNFVGWTGFEPATLPTPRSGCAIPAYGGTPPV